MSIHQKKNNKIKLSVKSKEKYELEKQNQLMILEHQKQIDKYEYQ